MFKGTLDTDIGYIDFFYSEDEFAYYFQNEWGDVSQTFETEMEALDCLNNNKIVWEKF